MNQSNVKRLADVAPYRGQGKSEFREKFVLRNFSFNIFTLF